MIGEMVRRFILNDENSLLLVVDNTEHLLHQIDIGKLDFALIEGHFEKNIYGYIPYRKEPFVGICAPDHHFSGRDISLAELLQDTLICREPGSGTRAILENRLMEYNESISHFKRSICISSFPIIMDCVRHGIGVSFVYDVLARQDFRHLH